MKESKTTRYRLLAVLNDETNKDLPFLELLKMAQCSWSVFRKMTQNLVFREELQSTLLSIDPSHMTMHGNITTYNNIGELHSSDSWDLRSMYPTYVPHVLPWKCILNFDYLTNSNVKISKKQYIF